MSHSRVDDIHTRKTNPRDTIPMDRNEKNQGEGNVTADREYREGVAQTIADKNVDQLAKQAKQALDGPEGDALREAERTAKKVGNAPPKKAPAKPH